MSLTLNAIDALLQATVPRLIAPLNARIRIDNTAPVFHQSVGGTFNPTSIGFTAYLDFLEGTVSWSSSGCTLTSISGNTCTLLASDMPGVAATITAQVTYRGTLFSTTVDVSKVADGSIGANGDRGAGKFFAAGTSWSNTVANAATPGANVVDDVVNITDNATFVQEKRWDGANWVPMGAYYDGTLLVTGTVTSGALATGSVVATKISVSSLAAISSNFGSVDIASGGFLRSGQTAWNTGTGFWLGSVGGVPKFSIGTAGGARLTWDGSVLTIAGETKDTFTVVMSNALPTSVARGYVTYGTKLTTVTGGTAPFSYKWYASGTRLSNDAMAEYFILGSNTGSTCTIRGTCGAAGPSDTIIGSITVIVTDANGRTCSDTNGHNPTHA